MNEDNSLLILDDDEIFCKRLQTAMSRKGFDSYGAYSIKEAKAISSSLSTFRSEDKFPFN